MLPNQDLFVNRTRCTGLDMPIAVAVDTGCGIANDRAARLSVVTWQRMETILERYDGSFHRRLLGDNVAYPCALDELLTGEHHLYQQSGDDERNGRVEQCEPVCLCEVRAAARHILCAV